ncbi:EI24 domain-containing protein [Hugenholtzia roseola]|uniref:EI24 domain-containing protein n=1 Tax=Hugenholtzia roseola TaxID=1002 RepID=UPI000410D767|nr:EI24 domain-containing protein [Hugenholtzia roseola]
MVRDFSKAFFAGLLAPWRALAFSREQRFWHYYLLPMFLNCLLFLLLLAGAYFFSDFANEKVQQWLQAQTWGNLWRGVFEWLFRILLFLSLFLLYFKTYKVLLLTLLSPLFSYIAGKIEEIQNPQWESPPFSIAIFWQDLRRGLIINLTNLAIELSLTLPLLLLGFFVSILSPFTTLLVVLIESFFWGFGLLDFRNETIRRNVAESRAFVWQNKAFTLGLGLMVYLMLLVPILGVLIAPILGVIGACRASWALEAEKIASKS